MENMPPLILVEPTTRQKHYRLAEVILKGSVSYNEEEVKLERVSVICPACRQQVDAVATDGRVKGYCAVARQSVDFLVETQQVPIGKHFTAEAMDKISAAAKKRCQDPEYRDKVSAAIKKRWQDPEYRAKMSAAANKRGQDPEY